MSIINENKTYTVIFDENCLGFHNDPEVVRFFLIQAENYVNDKLKFMGTLALNDVLDSIGHHRTKYGLTNGWTCKRRTKDNRIRFNAEQIDNGPRFKLTFITDGDISQYFD